MVHERRFHDRLDEKHGSFISSVHLYASGLRLMAGRRNGFPLVTGHLAAHIELLPTSANHPPVKPARRSPTWI
jgi:hypothetical protein